MRVESKSGLVFEFVWIEPYKRKDGTMTEIKVWKSNCKVCGEEFRISTPAYAEKLEDSRAFGRLHCSDHKLSREEVIERWQQSMKAKD